MARPGPKNKPLELKRIEGTYRADRAPDVEIQTINVAPSCPWEGDPLVQEWFDRIVNYLTLENRGSASDEMILWVVARRCAEIQELDFNIALNGRTYWVEMSKGNGGKQLKANPAVSQRNAAEKHLHALLAEIGLTPSSRSSVSASLTPVKANGWEDFDQAVN